MEIHHIADSGVAIKFSKGIVAVNPSEKLKKSLIPTVVLTTYSVPVAGWSAVFTATEGQRVFTGAGEYEKDGIAIRGFSALTELKGERLQTTSWCVEADDMRILVLGDIMHSDDIQSALPEFVGADVLIPLLSETKEPRLSAAAIAGIAAGLQAKRVLPIGNNGEVKKKLRKEMGDVEEVSGKYTLRKRDLSDEGSRLVLLS